MIEAMLIGAAIFATGALFGRLMPSRKRGPKPVEAVCGCGHHYSLHDPKTGECHDTVAGGRVAVRDQTGKPVRDSWGEVVFTYEKGRCGCRRYTGPEPLPEYVAPGDGQAGGRWRVRCQQGGVGRLGALAGRSGDHAPAGRRCGVRRHRARHGAGPAGIVTAEPVG